MPSNSPPNNPYAQAANTYGDHAQKNTPDQRELEARVLLKSAKMLADLQADISNATSEVIESTLKYNRQIWMMFYDTAMENPEGNRLNDLRSNIVNLANFVFKREMEIMSAPSPEKFDILISFCDQANGFHMLPGLSEVKSSENGQIKQFSAKNDLFSLRVNLDFGKTSKMSLKMFSSTCE